VLLALLNFGAETFAQSKRAFQKKSRAAQVEAKRRTAPRREKIIFPRDCDFYATGNNASERKLENGSAAAVESILPALPRADCDYEQFLRRNSFDEFLLYLSDYQSRQVRFYPLAANKYLVEVPCSTAAYNVSNVYLLYDETKLPAKAEILEFPDFEFTYDEDTDKVEKIENVSTKTVGGRGFDRRTKQLIVFVKARGLGDAGRYARYRFPDAKPVLVEYRAKFSWTGRGYSAVEVLKRPPRAWKRYFPK
jgi:hypothetical protein